MRLLACLAALFFFAVGGCTPIQQPPHPPIELPKQRAVDKAETDFYIAERIWPSAERALESGQTITITLRVTAKTKLDYLFWREIIGGYAVADVSSQSDLEFMVLYMPAGATHTWQYDLTGRRSGSDTIDGVIKAVSGPIAIDARIKATVSVR